MVIDLAETIHVLKELNNECKIPIIKKKEFEEQEDNLKDFQKAIDDMNILLKKIKNKKSNHNLDQVMEDLIHLHISYCDVIWHIEQVHGMVRKITGNYRDNCKKT